MFARFNLPRTAAVVSGAMATLIIAVPATAVQDSQVVVHAQPEDVRSEQVSYSDLNLAERRDERRLHSRVGKAVRHVCLFETGRHGLQSNGYYRCADGAWDGARPQIAQAVTRAREVASRGESSIAATAITISAAAD